MGFQDFKGNMRPQNKRSRGRGHNPNNPNNPNRPRGPNRQQTFDSNGPNVKIRGNAYQVFERYIALAREAASSGDRIAAENLYQHAEHYYRIMNANGEGYGQAPRPTTPADNEMGMGDPEPGQPQGQHQPQPSHQSHQSHQPYQQHGQPQSYDHTQPSPPQGQPHVEPDQPSEPHDPGAEPQPY
jgi:Domain of unknown function (DUF4167)